MGYEIMKQSEVDHAIHQASWDLLRESMSVKSDETLYYHVSYRMPDKVKTITGCAGFMGSVLIETKELRVMPKKAIGF